MKNYLPYRAVFQMLCCCCCCCPEQKESGFVEKKNQTAEYRNKQKRTVMVYDYKTANDDVDFYLKDERRSLQLYGLGLQCNFGLPLA